jgi:hypothetical protein
MAHSPTKEGVLDGPVGYGSSWAPTKDGVVAFDEHNTPRALALTFNSHVWG